MTEHMNPKFSDLMGKTLIAVRGCEADSGDPT
jgi:hypothetical protein